MLDRGLARLALALLLLPQMGSGCGGESATSSMLMVALPPAAGTHRPDACPLTIDGVRADIETTGRGVTINLTAQPDQIMLLRARAKDVASSEGGLYKACSCGASSDAVSLPPSDVNVDDTEGGTRIVVAARDPNDAPALASRLRIQLSRVHGGDCPGR